MSVEIEFRGRVSFPEDRPIVEVARELAALGLRLRSTRTGLVAEPVVPPGDLARRPQ